MKRQGEAPPEDNKIRPRIIPGFPAVSAGQTAYRHHGNAKRRPRVSGRLARRH
jgi:hypothetical protein